MTVQGGAIQRRRLVALVGVLILLAMTLPAVVEASQTYKIKNSSGRVVGTMKSSDDLTYTVRNRGGARVGTIQVGAKSGCSIHRGSLSGPQIAWSYGRLLHPDGSQRVIGRAFHVGTKWVIKKRVNGKYRKVGAVPVACYSGFALGAGRLLLW